MATKGTTKKVSGAKKPATKKCATATATKGKTTGKAVKYVYAFKDGYGLGKPLLGGKGAGLAEMAHIGIRIPDGFTITTEACTLYYDSGRVIPENLIKQIKQAIKELQTRTGKTFGKGPNPLLVSVRSGARVSMPGMMDTILNLGLNDVTVQALAKKSNNERFAYDCYRRFILMFTNIARGWPRTEMDQMLDEVKKRLGLANDFEVPVEELKGLVVKYKEYYKEKFHEDFPSNPEDQLLIAVQAIFRSWDNERANLYRKMNNIPYSWGTAVNVQSMAFGNMGENSGTGVGFTRHPTDGVKEIFAEYLINAQGEDVVAGIRTPLHIDALKKQQPKIYKQLVDSADKLEKHYKDLQDFEFTVEDGVLYFLQTRNGKRTGLAGLKIATDMVKEKLINEQEALLRVDPRSLDQLLHPTFVEADLKKAVVIGHGNPASPGAAVGSIVFTAEAAQQKLAQDKNAKMILVRAETSPEDLGGMVACCGILTARGGMTSHAAVVARGMGKCCVSGAGALVIDYANKTLKVAGHTLKEGDFISINGSTGEVYLGAVATKDAELDADFTELMNLADKYSRLKVRTNADTPHDAETARKFGAVGIGLCRTEHMFFEGEKIKAMREMILAETLEGRRAALRKILPYQQADFKGIFKAMEGCPVTVRLLDPPLHEFVPHEEKEQRELAEIMGVTFDYIRNRVNSLHEANPMLGHRGCRLGNTYPEITEMQTKAILGAALDLKKEGVVAIPEIMVPLTGILYEFANQEKIIRETAEKLFAERNDRIDFKVGTMIEIPRAALTANRIASKAEFFSFGTNDLTQMTFGYSRDDIASFLPAYLDMKILKNDPFQVLDRNGVGQLVQMATEKGRSVRPDLKCGICGEHGGEPSSVEFCHIVGLDYVSCSPFRVPIARLAAAQAAIRNK
ncbi:MAG: pyruvate, phosphate dikinase [Candidatus Enterosoma sp.]|nr:pyruvate, phosphate dikinase [Candidatus Enterosoma sp.]